MSSFTYEGSLSQALQWWPFAIGQQAVMAKHGQVMKTVVPAPGVTVMIRTAPNHVHIIAGEIGYEFSIHLYPFFGNDIEVAYFLDTKDAKQKDGVGESILGSPYQDGLIPSTPVQGNHINMWMGEEGRVMTGCNGQRYGSGVGLSTSNMSDKVTERYPRLVIDRQLLWEGDQLVTAAAIVFGVKVGVSLDGGLHYWSGTNNDHSFFPTVLGAGTECYWVFNKAGTECVGIDYGIYDSQVERTANLIRITWTEEFINNGTEQIITPEYTSEPINISTYAADYDRTEDADELITCEFKSYNRGSYTLFPGYIGTEKNPPDYRDTFEAYRFQEGDYSFVKDGVTLNGYFYWYYKDAWEDVPVGLIGDVAPYVGTRTDLGSMFWMDAVDTTMVISRGFTSKKLADIIPFAYNDRGTDLPLGRVDPTDVSYRGSLIGMDLRYRSYCISTDGYISSPTEIVSTHTPTFNTNITCVVNGKAVMNGALSSGTIVPFEGMQTPSKNVPEQYRIMTSYELVRRAEGLAVSPKGDEAATYVRTTFTGLSHDIDFNSSETSMFGGYHANVLDKFISDGNSIGYSETLISTYNSWV